MQLLFSWECLKKQFFMLNTKTSTALGYQVSSDCVREHGVSQEPPSLCEQSRGDPPHPPSSSGLGSHSPALPPGEPQGRRTWWAAVRGVAKSDTTERLPFDFSLSCTAEGNGTPLQCPCLENPRDRGAWWAAFSGVTLSRTRLK